METRSITKAGKTVHALVISHQAYHFPSWDPIVRYIKVISHLHFIHSQLNPNLILSQDQHSAYLRKELTAMRDRYIQDTRIHCCLFFIKPTGHSLRPIDVIVLRKLSEVVNVVPVIAKSDSLTLEEREAFKQRVRISFPGFRTSNPSHYCDRFAPNSFTMKSAYTHSTRMKQMPKKCNSTSRLGYIC